MYLGAYDSAVRKRIEGLEERRFPARLWRRDPSLWSSDQREQESIRGALDWLNVADRMEEGGNHLSEFAAEVKADGLRSVVLLGMGGSSLAPLVFARLFPRNGGLPVSVLDTTDPVTILEVEKRESPGTDAVRRCQ